MIIFIVLLPLRLLSSAVLLSSTRQVHFSATGRHRRHLLGSVFHSLHVSTVFCSLLFLILLLVCPSLSLGQQCSQPEPSFQSPILIPHSSICPPLNCHYSFLLPIRHPYQSNLTFSKRSLFLTRYLITLLLLPSGSVELNPGPVVIDPTVSYSCLNIRSASTITNAVNKPNLLQEFIG